MNVVCTAFPGIIVPVKGRPDAHAHMTATPDGRREFQTCGLRSIKASAQDRRNDP